MSHVRRFLVDALPRRAITFALFDGDHGLEVQSAMCLSQWLLLLPVLPWR